MLDHVSISHQSGIVLWAKSYTPSAAALVANPLTSPVNAFVKDVLLEGRTPAAASGGAQGAVASPSTSTSTAAPSYEAGGWKLEWTLANDLDLVVVVAYHRLLHLAYVPALLETAKQLFLVRFGDVLREFVMSLRGGSTAASDREWDLDKLLDGWDAIWEKVLKKAEAGDAKARKPFSRGNSAIPSTPPPTKAGSVAKVSAATTPRSDAQTPSTPAEAQSPQTAEEIAKNVQALKARLRSGATKKQKADSPTPSDTDSPRKKAASKVMRKWGNSSASASEMAALDFSAPPPLSTDGVDGEDGGPPVDTSTLIDRGALGSRDLRSGLYDVADLNAGPPSDDDEDDEEDSEDELISRTLAQAALTTKNRLSAEPSSSTATAPASGMLSGLFARLKGGKALERADLAPVLEGMERHLMSKNVAREIAEKLCESVGAALVGKKLGSFGSVKTEVRDALSQSITRILTPKSSTDILLEIKRKQAQSLAPAASAAVKPEPYKLVFVGVNGVGKSTNLSKVAFWLLQNDLRVLIAACDTFRSGAVEQLRVHVRNLSRLDVGAGEGSAKGKVELYEKGYGKDSAGIAREAIAFAKDNEFDVVLIDTAGRMQDNEPLMRALAKLVTVNTPDKVVFVGEALVGNEAVDQLARFDRSLKDFSASAKGGARGIDGMILTKFDTIDDKVGAALSMTYVTGQPILFVGCGQTYTDLRHLRVNHIVQALLKD